METERLMLAVVVLVLVGQACRAEAGRTLVDTRDRFASLAETFDIQVNGWRAHLGDPDGAEKPDFDDSQWDPVDVG